MSQDTFYPPETLRQFASRCLEAVGVPAETAETVADNLTDAHLRGVDSHGVTRLIEIYVERLEAGVIVTNTPTYCIEEVAEPIRQKFIELGRRLGVPFE